MARRNYWKGFAAGAAIGAGASAVALLLPSVWGRARHSRIVRMEKSIQIGRPVEECFSAWRQLERLPRMSSIIENVRREGNRSHWSVRLDGRRLEWTSEIEQLIPNQAIGWKSIKGLKHTGRITFSPLGNDTLVHVSMNYAPPSRVLRPFMEPWIGRLEGFIEQALREFKAALENGATGTQTGPRSYPAGTTTEPARGTGTFGAAPTNPGQTSHGPQNPRFGGTTNPVEYTSPPEAKR